MKNGKFVISLDFELFWGVRDKKTIEEYGINIKAVHQVIPRLLETFNKYKIHATFSTVGLLFFENKRELLTNLPELLPSYETTIYSPYTGYFDQVGNNFEVDPYHFAPQLIKLIQKFPEHEIGTHTFSHYYCLEGGQTVNEFKADILSAQKVASRYNINLTSLIFPRNQFNGDYLNCCKELGITCYRGTENSWMYKARNRGQESLLRRVFRLLDSYLNISGHNCYSDEYMLSSQPVDIPSSRFLRPYSEKLKIFDRFRLKRIESGMKFAAMNGLTYHLWWHPHNFGINQNENFNFLEEILNYYKELNKQYNFQSYSMSELVKTIKK